MDHSEQRSPRHTLTDVIFFDLDELQTQSALLPSLPPPPLSPPVSRERASVRPLPMLTMPERPSLSQVLPTLAPAPYPASPYSLPPAPRASTPRVSASQQPAPRASSARASSPRLSSPRAVAQRPQAAMSVSILTFATSDASGLARKLENTLAMCRTSRHKTEIIVACDGYDAAVWAVARAYESEGVRVLSWRDRVGPLATWAQVSHAARHDFVFFSDVNARMAPATLDQLLAPLRDPDVGMTVPSYVPCVQEGPHVRARLEAATQGITAASYAGVVVRRRLLRRPAHDTVQPGLVAALQVLGEGYEVVSLPSARVFHPEVTSARARFARTVQHTQGQIQAALRQRDALLSERKMMFFAMLREGLKHVPALAAWLACMLTLLLLGQGVEALGVFSVGALAVARANSMRTHRGRSRLQRFGASLTAGIAQMYGLLRART